MTDEPRDELRVLREFCTDSPNPNTTHYIHGEFAEPPEGLAAGLEAEGWQQAGYLSVEGGRVFDVAPDGTRTEIEP